MYNATGQQLVPDSWATTPPTKGHSEFIFVPVPGECSKWYGITLDRIDYTSSYGNSSFGSFGALILSYCILDANLNQGDGDVIQQPNGNNVDWIDIGLRRNVEQCIDKFHIGVTKLQAKGMKRFLFATACNYLLVFEITQNGIEEVHRDEFEYQGSIPLRSELEIDETDQKISVAFPTVTMVSSQYGLREVGGLDIFDFTRQTTGDILLNYHQEEALNLPNELVILVKGLEYSSDGKHLYATFVYWDRNIIYSNSSGVSFDSEIIHLKRSNVIFTLESNIDLGVGNSDFSIGMIEKGPDDRLWFIGQERMGYLADCNDPSSLFTPGAILLDTRYTFHSPLWSNGFNAFTMLLLLPDQIDGEIFEETFYVDQYPETLMVCSLPHSMQSQYFTDWSYSYLSHKEPLEYIYEGLGLGYDMSIPGEGTVYATYTTPSGCIKTETVEIIWNPVARYGADFTFTTSIQNGSMSISANPLATNAAAHSWVLYLNNGGNWIAINTSNGLAPLFTNLDPNQQYKIDHTIIPIQPFNCMYNANTFKIIN